MWLLASLNRIPWLRECLLTMQEVGVSTPGKIILGPQQETDIPNVPLPHNNWTIECQHKDDKSLMDVMNRFVRDYPDLPFYGYLQDDLTFKTRNWDKQLIAAAGKTKIASCNDKWRAPKRNTGACAFGGDLVRTWGFWGPPKLQHCYMDDFWEDSGRECRNWVVLMDVITPHKHFANPKNKAPMDATYKFSYAPGGEDMTEWKRYSTSQDYADLLARVKNLTAAAVA